MSNKFTVKHAKSMKDVVKWVRDNPHFEGWWTGPRPREFKSFNLRGNNCMLVIPADLYDTDMIDCADAVNELRLYRPSEKGLELLKRRKKAA